MNVEEEELKCCLKAHNGVCPFVAWRATSFWTIEWSYSSVQEGPEESFSFLEQLV